MTSEELKLYELSVMFLHLLEAFDNKIQVDIKTVLSIYKETQHSHFKRA